MNEHEVWVRGLNRVEAGWCQGGDGDSPDGDDRGYCAALALSSWCCWDWDALERACRIVGVKDINALFDWNDAPERRKAEVVALLRQGVAETAPLPSDPTTEVTLELVA